MLLSAAAACTAIALATADSDCVAERYLEERAEEIVAFIAHDCLPVPPSSTFKTGFRETMKFLLGMY